MCGIVGYVGPRQATPLLIAGLRKLEYRGYDSAGLAVTDEGRMQVVRCRGKLPASKTCSQASRRRAPSASATRAGRRTGGRPRSTPPAQGRPDRVIHNGIIENHLALRARLDAAGRKFSSETDTEIAAHLIDEALLGGRAEPDRGGAQGARAGRAAATRCGRLSDKHPGPIVAAKIASPLVIGLGKGENFLASDVPAFLEHTREVIFIDEGDVAEITSARRQAHRLRRHAGRPRRRKTITWDAAAGREGRLPALHAQGDPRAAARHRGHAAGAPDLEKHDADLDGFEIDARALRRVVLLACGTSYHAAWSASSSIEALGAHPVRGRPGQRVPLSRSGRRPRRPRHRDLAVRRDRRHAGAP